MDERRKIKRYLSQGLRITIFLFCCLVMTVKIYGGKVSNNDSLSEKKSDSAQIIIAPLFEYPVAPEELEDLTERTNYLMEHFWDKMNFKTKQAVDQNALNDAFGVYASAIPYADRSKVVISVNKLLKSLSKNPTLLYQFTKAAEDNLYGPRAGVWIDEVYMKFLEETVKNKKISQGRKARFADQLLRLTNTRSGETMAPLQLNDSEGKIEEWKPTAPLNVIEFGSPDCDDCRRARILMDVNLPFLDKLEDGSVSMTFVIIEEDPDGMLMGMTKNYPAGWKVGGNDTAVEIFDLRSTPSFYILDAEGKILAKNLDVNSMLNFLNQERK